MDRYLVLSKIFSLTEQLQADKKKRIQEHTHNNSLKEVDMVKIPYAARGILTSILNNENINQRTIAKLMNISSQAVSEHIKKLESLQYVEKISGAQNNENIIVLTPKGREIAEESNRRIRSHADRVLSSLSDDEVETFNHLLIKLLKQWE